MRVFSRFTVIAIVLCLVGLIVLQAESVGSFFNEGKKAEEKGDYDRAYWAYKQAFDRKPAELKYRTAYLRVKGLASESHVKLGEKLRDQGKFQEAIVEFQRAEEIDPSNFLADQELRRTQDMISSGAKPIKQQKPETPIERRLDEAQGPVDLQPINNDSINMRMSADAKTVYSSIGKIAGLNVIFDPDFQSKPLTVDLNKVSLNDALYIVGTLSNTFWKPVTQNTIFVAQNSQQKRKELEDNVVKTFYLSNLSQPTEIQDVVNALRNILELRYVFPINSEQTIVVRGSPDQLAVAQKIIEDMDKAKPEVVIDVKVLSVSREKVRDLGLAPPTSISAQLQSLTSTNSTTSTGTTTTTGTTTGTTTNGLTLNDLGNLNAQNFAITIPSATANLNFTDSDTKLLQNPQVRASDGEKATLKIGQRIPIATGSFGAPAGTTAGLGLVANTQFQYIDVGVNVDITPKIHANDEVSMKISLDISSQINTVSIGGVNQPVIAQNKVEHTVRVKEGEVTILGGFMEEQDAKSLAGLPFLSQVPVLKYFFSSTHTDKLDTQIVFVLTPRIVRGQDLNDQNLRAIDIGTQSGVELRRVSKPQVEATPAPTPAPQVVNNSNSQPQLVIPVQQPTPAPTPNAAPTMPPDQGGQSTFKFDPPATTVSTGSNFSVNVNILNGQDVWSVPLEITYNPNIVSITDVLNGNLLTQDGQPVALVHRDDGTGTLTISATRPPGTPGISGTGTVVTINMQAKGKGQAVLAIAKQGSKNHQQQPLSIMGAMTMVNVQ